MEFNKRLNSFLQLKNILQSLDPDMLDHLAEKAKIKNQWFTKESIKASLQGVIFMLDEYQLKSWTSHYQKEPVKVKNIGVIMAGNIPMVGFHDMLCVLISGHHLSAKLSSQDDVLIPFIADKLIETDPEWKEKIHLVEKVKDVDAVIATGSDNTARYFEYYFKDKPRLIRKNRTSVAVLSGSEQEENLQNLGKDIYLYFGLGCRNVSKIYLPKGYDIPHLLDQLNDWSMVADYHKYVNNYNYQRAIYSMERIPHYDNGFTLFTENEQLVSPTAVIYYEFYENNVALQRTIDAYEEKIQCIVSENGWYKDSIPFGEAQSPKVDDYADNVDTMKFLEDLK